jgi:aerobic carbon-monoxide dehydrogenase large subunit
VRQRRLSRDLRSLPRRVWLGEKRALQGHEIGGRYHGVAVACFIEGGGAGPKETARLDLEADGTVSVYVGSAAVGQGLETVMAQIAADALGLPLGQANEPTHRPISFK